MMNKLPSPPRARFAPNGTDSLIFLELKSVFICLQMDMEVCKYSEWQYNKITNRKLIDATVLALENVINYPHEYISGSDEWCIQHVIDMLNTRQGIGACTTFPFSDFVDGSFIPDSDKIYVVRKKVTFEH
jgi:hypothetical protein